MKKRFSLYSDGTGLCSWFLPHFLWLHTLTDEWKVIRTSWSGWSLSLRPLLKSMAFVRTPFLCLSLNELQISAKRSTLCKQLNINDQITNRFHYSPSVVLNQNSNLCMQYCGMWVYYRAALLTGRARLLVACVRCLRVLLWHWNQPQPEPG